MNDRLQRVEAKIEKSGADVRRLTLTISLFMLTLIALVVAAAMATDIFKVEYNGTTRFQVDDKGTATINADTSAADVALKILSASTSRGDMKFVARATDPTNPQAGDFWYNSTEKRFKMYDGTSRYLLSLELTQVVADGKGANDGWRGSGSAVETSDPAWTTDAKLGGSALSFDGSNDYASATNSASLNFGTGNFTVEAWIRGSASGDMYIAGKSDGNNNGWFLRLSDSPSYIYFFTCDTFPTNYRDARQTTTNYLDNFWHHVVGVKAGPNQADMYIYVDGADVTSARQSAGNNPNVNIANNLLIGAKTSGTGFFNGQIDEVAIWNRALSAAEVTARHNGGAGAELVGNEAGLVSVWHFNDPK